MNRVSWGFVATLVVSQAQAMERPVVFEERAPAQFLAHAHGFQLGLSGAGATLTLPNGSRVGLAPVAARAVPLEADGSRSTINTYHGNRPEAWRAGRRASSALRQRGLWQGIDLCWYTQNGELEYDLIVAPGSDPRKIGFRTHGATPRLLPNGTLAMGTLRWKPPVAYQLQAGKRVSVPARYRLSKSGILGFSLGRYDRKKPLVIDPALVSSSFLGGAGQEYVFGVTTDASGAAYVMGATTSGGAGRKDLFVSKISAAGTLVYTTFIGGSNNDGGSDLGGIAVDSAGNAFVTSDTFSTDFPATPGAFQTTSGGRLDAALVKLSPTGALLWASYYGGTQDEFPAAVTISPTGQPVIVGQTTSSDLSTTPGAFQRTRGTGNDGFIARFPSGGNGLLYGTFLGGNDLDFVAAATYSASGNLYVTGGTYSSNFPILLPPGASHLGLGGGSDTFVARFNPDNSVGYINRFGGSNEDQPKFSGALTVDSLENVTVVGETNSTDFPVYGGLQSAPQGSMDGFVFQLGPTGLRNWATYLGGSGFDSAFAVSADAGGMLYITGTSASNNFPLDGAFFTNPGAYALRLTSSGALAGSTFLDRQLGVAGIVSIPTALGDAWVAGSTSSTTMPTRDAFQPSFGGGFSDGFLSRLHFDAVDLEVTQTAAPYTYYSGDVATFTIRVTNIGPDAASNVTLTDTISGTELADPDNHATLTLLGADTTLGSLTISGRVVTVNLGTMVPGATATIRVSVRMTVETANLAVFSRAVVATTPTDARPRNNTSTTSLLTHVDTRPRIVSLSPSAVAAGSPDFELTVRGQNFLPGSVVRVNGLLRSTTYIDSYLVRAQVRAGDVSAPGVVPITVQTPEGTSPAALLTVGTPRLSLSATARVAPGGGWLLDVRVLNSGTAAALSTLLNTATLGSTSTTSSLPQLLGTVGTSGAATTTLAFPASSGVSGNSALLRLSGSHALGTFGGTLRVLLP